MRDRAEFTLLKALREGKKEALAGAFDWYYKDLVLFAGNYIRNLPQCEDIVQTVFIRLWEERAGLRIESSLKSYLIRAVRNTCLDYIRHRNVRDRYRAYVFRTGILGECDTEHYILHSELQYRFKKALERLPEEQRLCFEMSRMEGIRYEEIAERLHISVRTVENRIGEALRQLKLELKDFFIFFLFWLL